MPERIQVSVDERIALLEIKRPEVLNAIDLPTAEEIHAAMTRIEADEDIWATIIKGTGDRAFSTGADLKALSEGKPRASITGAGFAGFVRFPRTKPVIAAVNGIALGGGFEIVLACDLVVAARHANFGLPEVSRGIVAGGGGLVHLSRTLPPAAAAELVIAGAIWSAERAHRMGLVNLVVEGSDLLAEAMSLARKVTANAPLAVRASLDILSKARWASSLDEAWQHSDENSARVRGSLDAIEGPRAFAEKRPPQWKGE